MKARFLFFAQGGGPGPSLRPWRWPAVLLSLLWAAQGLAQAPVDAKELEAMRAAAARNSGSRFLGADGPVLLGVILGLTAILFFWAFFLRKRPKQARGSLVVTRGAHGAGGSSSGSGSGSGRRKRRKRRPDHPDNWGRNPTLGETGGLPPTRRDEEQPPSEPEAPPAR